MYGKVLGYFVALCFLIHKKQALVIRCRLSKNNNDEIIKYTEHALNSEYFALHTKVRELLKEEVVSSSVFKLNKLFYFAKQRINRKKSSICCLPFYILSCIIKKSVYCVKFKKKGEL